MLILGKELVFPPTYLADADGLLCIGGDLSIARLRLAYSLGIFPWYNDGEPICWYTPPQRFVLFPQELHISKSMKQRLNANTFTCNINQQFNEVIHQCKILSRKGQDGTWITDEMEQAYIQLYKNGDAISIECLQQNELVGGLYGVLCGKVFTGESMFSLISNASKFALIKGIDYLQTQGVTLIDCQVPSAHLESMGARIISRSVFERFLK